MPKGRVIEADNYPLPEDVLINARLDRVEYVEIPFTYRQGPKQGQQGLLQKWEWEFACLGEYEGITAKGNTEPKITNATEQGGSLKLARPWYETLLTREMTVGEDIDTDLLLGLPCQITVKHQEPRPRKDGDGFWFNVEVDDVYPASDVKPDDIPF